MVQGVGASVSADKADRRQIPGIQAAGSTKKSCFSVRSTRSFQFQALAQFSVSTVAGSQDGGTSYAR